MEKYTGVVLSAQNVAEVDRIYTIYTLEAGKIRALGKGARRQEARLAGSLEPITQSEIFLAKRKGMGAITGAIPVCGFFGIKANLSALQKVFFSFQSLQDLIPEQEKDEKVFNLLICYLETMETLTSWESSEDIAQIVTLGFLLKVLDVLGYGIEVYRCVHCEQALAPSNNYFSAARGGVLCRRCCALEERKVAISEGSIKLIRIFLQNKLSSLPRLRVIREDIKNLNLIVGELLRWIIGS